MMRIKTGGWIWLEKLNKNWHLKKSENLRNGVFSVSLFFYSGDESWIERNNADSCKNEKEYGVDKIFTRYLIWASRVNSNLVIGVLPGEWVNIFVAYLLDFFLTVRSSFVDVCIINIHRTYGHIQFSIIDKYRVRWLSLLEQRRYQSENQLERTSWGLCIKRQQYLQRMDVSFSNSFSI